MATFYINGGFSFCLFMSFSNQGSMYIVMGKYLQ